nr:hypothetical protein [Tanacetum cinerariifolium]
MLQPTNIRKSVRHTQLRKFKRFICGGMERGFLSQKGSGGGRGVKEKSLIASNIEAIKDGTVPSVTVAIGNTQEENVGYSMDGLESMLENGLWFIRNNPLILQKWNPNVTLMKEDVVNVLVWVKLHGVPVNAFTEDGLSTISLDIDTHLMLDSYTSDMCTQSWGMSCYARALIEIQAGAELKDTIVVAMPKLTREGFHTCTVHVEYEWKPPRYTCCKVFGHVKEECPTNPGLGVAKNLKKPSQASSGVSVSSKAGFKLAKEYKPVAKKPTANASGNKKKSMKPTKEVSNLNQFNVLNSVVNDEELGTNGGVSNLVTNGSNSNGTLVDYPGDHDSDDKVYSVDNDMAHSMATETIGFGAQSLLEQ